MPLLREVALPTAILILLSAYYWQTRSLPIASTMFPYLVMAILAGLSVAIIIKAVVNRSLQTYAAEDSIRYVVILLGMSVGFIALFVQFNFLVASSVFLFSMFVLLGTKPFLAFAVAVGVTGAYYLIFAVLLGLSL